MGHERKQYSGLIPIDSGVTKLARRGEVVVDVEQTGRTLEEAQAEMLKHQRAACHFRALCHLCGL